MLLKDSGRISNLRKQPGKTPAAAPQRGRWQQAGGFGEEGGAAGGCGLCAPTAAPPAAADPARGPRSPSGHALGGAWRGSGRRGAQAPSRSGRRPRACGAGGWLRPAAARFLLGLPTRSRGPGPPVADCQQPSRSGRAGAERMPTGRGLLWLGLVLGSVCAILGTGAPGSSATGAVLAQISGFPPFSPAFPPCLHSSLLLSLPPARPHHFFL